MMKKFEETFGRNPVFGMIHTQSGENMDVLELAKKEIGMYLKFMDTTFKGYRVMIP